MDSNIQYYYYVGDTQYGPCTIDDLRELSLSSNTMVMSSYSNRWKPASSYPELATYCSAPSEEPVSANIPTAPVASGVVADWCATEFYYYDASNQSAHGPFSIFELAILDIQPTSHVSIGNPNDWRAAADIPDLLQVIQVINEDMGQAPVVEQVIELPHVDDSEKNAIIEEQEGVILEMERTISNLQQENEVLRNTKQEKRKQNTITEFAQQIKAIETSIDKYRQCSCPELSQYEAIHQSYRSLLEDMVAATYENNFSNEDIFNLRSSLDTLSDYFNSTVLPVGAQTYECADVNSNLWDELVPSTRRVPQSYFLLGHNTTRFNVFGDVISVNKDEYLDFLNNHNIVAHYNQETQEKCFGVFNTLIGRLLLSSLPGKFSVKVVDLLEMEGLSAAFKRLNKCVTVYSRETDVRQMLETELQNIQNTIQNQLVAPFKHIGEYNRDKNNPEPYSLIILKAFPIGMREDLTMLVRQVMNNGPRAGVNVALLVNDDELAISDRASQTLAAMQLNRWSDTIIPLDFTKQQYPFSIQGRGITQSFRFTNLGESTLMDIVRHLLDSMENKTSDIVTFSNYLDEESKWWNRTSEKNISIPFGISEEKEVVKLSITQESGENSVMVVGVPGSGKSVFLHTIICSAAVRYSPEELEMYLMDFSGVEFNTYAVHDLPHAKVIAPEAEREFGLSVLRELKEEGARRMEICRNYGVSNIVDLRKVCSDAKVPRLLVIIDEFQKMFEIETDPISREAMTIIHIIIKEFRKFGINLILATQKIADINSSILPKDLIANRVVFKCSPSDTGLIGMNTVPQLRTGACIYNSELGVASANRRVQSFYINKMEIDALLDRIAEMAKREKVTVKKTITFRSDDLPEINIPYTIMPSENPSDVNIFFGQSIAISDTDVSAVLSKRSADNVLIVGGEPDVAEKIAISTGDSIRAAYSDNSVDLYFFNFMRPTDELSAIPQQLHNVPFYDITWATKADAVTAALTKVKSEIDARVADENVPQRHIFITIYALELAQMFKRTGRRDDVSEAGSMLAYILNKGPLVGVFTILQVDTYTNLQQLGDVLNFFAHRIALQMDDRESQKIVGSDIASKLYVMNRPSSKYRAYYFNTRNRVLSKFKPYKLTI